MDRLESIFNGAKGKIYIWDDLGPIYVPQEAKSVWDELGPFRHPPRVKGVLIDFNYVLDRFWGDIRTQDTWLPLKWSSENFLTVSEKILKILLLHGNIVDGVGTFLDPISQRGMVTHHGWCFLNVN